MTLRQCPVMIGRQQELNEVLAALEAARGSDEPVVVLVAGEAGIGKSRLVREAVDVARADGVSVIRGQSLDLAGELLQGAALRDIVVDVLALLDGGGVVDVDGDGFAVERSILSRLLPERSGAGGGPVGTDQVCDLILGIVRRAARRGVVLVVFEDLHWADATTRELFTRFATSHWLGGVLTLATFRSDELHRRHPLLPVIANIVRAARPVRVDLDRLGRGAVREMCAAITGRHPDAAALDDVVRRSEGNPFFVEELLAVAPGDISTRLPDALRDVVLGRAALLGNDAVRVLRVVAAAGSLPADVIGEVSGLERGVLEATLELVRSGGLLVAGSGRWQFRHELSREVFHDQPGGLAAELHRSIAEALERAAVARPGELARHWLSAHDLPRALAASVAAGHEVLAAGGAADAIGHFERVLEMWDRVPDAERLVGADRAAVLLQASVASMHAGQLERGIVFGERAIAALAPVTADRTAREAEVWLHLRNLFRYRSRWDECADAVQQALALIPSEPPTAARAMALAYACLGAGYVTGPDTPRLAEEALKVAVASGDRDAVVFARTLPTGMSVDELIPHSLATIAMCGPATPVETTLRAHAALVLAYWFAVRNQEMEAVGERGLRLVRASGLAGPHGPIMVSALVWSMLESGRWGEVESVLDDNADLVDEELRLVGDVLFARTGRLFEARLVLARVDRELAEGVWNEHPGQAAQVVIEIGEACGRERDIVTFVGDVLDRMARWRSGFVLDMVAEAVGALADRLADAAREERDELRACWTVHAEEWIHRAGGLLAARHARWPLDDLAAPRVQAELSRLRGEADPVQWEAVADHFAGFELPYREAHARWRAAEAHLAGASGRTVAAHERAAVQARLAAAIAHRLGARPLLDKIEALQRHAHLDPAGQSATRKHDENEAVAADSFGLTPREREILSLIADGCPNGEIGARLFISTKTASVHVSNILRKLGVANRVEAATAAHRHRLLVDVVGDGADGGVAVGRRGPRG